MRDYMRYIDQTGGIYYTRWGDAPIRSLAVALVVPEAALHHFKVTFNPNPVSNPNPSPNPDATLNLQPVTYADLNSQVHPRP